MHEDEPRCQYCGADCTDGRSWDGGNLYACPTCANWRAQRNAARATTTSHSLPAGADQREHRAVMLPNGRIAVRCWPLATQPWMVTDPTGDPIGADSPAVCVRWLRDDQIPHDAVPLVPQHLATNFDK